MPRTRPFALALAAVLALAAPVAGCSTELNVRPRETVSTTPSLPDGAFTTPTPQESGVVAALMAGEVMVEIPVAWGEREQSSRVDEGYVLQDFTWFLDGSAEGDIVTAAGMTPAQAEALSSGTTFDGH